MNHPALRGTPPWEGNYLGSICNKLFLKRCNYFPISVSINMLVPIILLLIGFKLNIMDLIKPIIYERGSDDEANWHIDVQ